MKPATEILALCALFAACGQANLGTNVPIESQRFDIIQLGLVTRGGFCATEWCRNLHPGGTYPTWTIDALRASWSQGFSGPTYCSFCGFNLDDLKPLRPELDHYWPSYTRNTNEYFWRNQYYVYGSCVSRMQKPKQYFTMALQLYTAWNITNYLEKAGILPNDDTPALFSNITRALGHYLPPHAFTFYCSGTRHDVDILREIRLCFKVKSNQPAQCPLNVSTCRKNDRVWYLKSSSVFARALPNAVVILTALLGVGFMFTAG